MDRQHQTPKDDKSQPPAVVEVDWINFRSDKGRSDYGDHRCSLSVSQDEINYLRSLVSRCHSDTDPAPDDDQFYFFSITTRERKRWVMMRSQNNLDLMAQGERKGRVFNAILVSGESLQRILPNGNPLHLIDLPTFDVVGQLADELKTENHKDVDYRVQGRPLTFDAQYPKVTDRRAKYLAKQQLAYSPDSVQELFTKITLDCADNIRPLSFATWWSSLRPLPEYNPFEYVFLSPQPKQLIERGDALSKALRLVETVQKIDVPDALGPQAFHLWKAIVSLSERLYMDLNRVFNAASHDRSVWTNEWPRICTEPKLIAQKLMSLGERMISTNYNDDYRLVCETAENYQKLASDLRSVRPPSLSTKAVKLSESIPEPRETGTMISRLRPITRSPIMRWSIIVCLLLLLMGGVYFAVKQFQTSGSIAGTWSDRDTILKVAKNKCDTETVEFIKQNKILKGTQGRKADKKNKLTTLVQRLVEEKATYYYHHDKNGDEKKGRHSDVFRFFQNQINRASSVNQRKDINADRIRVLESERTELKNDLSKFLFEKHVRSFDEKYKPVDEPNQPINPSNPAPVSNTPNVTSTSPSRPRPIGNPQTSNFNQNSPD
jgi:hypothetical protein